MCAIGVLTHLSFDNLSIFIHIHIYHPYISLFSDEGDLDRPFNDMRYFLDLRQLETLGWKERWMALVLSGRVCSN